MTYENAFSGREDATVLDAIKWDETASQTGDSSISFGEYDNPDIEVDGSARFATHEIIGGTTVRQRIGQDPIEISMNGVCNEDTAGQIDLLRSAELVTLISPRLEYNVRCQVASTSTTPLESGGAADASTGDFLYQYTINLVEITPP